MVPTRSLQTDKLEEISTSDSRSKQKEKKTVGENKAMIGARHGYEFVDLITMAIILKAGSMMKEDELFSCGISKEDATAGKFDDIVFRYNYKGTASILKIQVKHRTKNQEVSLQELMETSFTEPFALIKYFQSFHEQYTRSNANQIFILCTNVQMKKDTEGWLEKVRPNDICNIFDPIGATYYRFRKITKEEPRSTNCIADALKRASESYRLAEVLASHIYGQKELILYTKNPQRNPLLSKYNNAIIRHMIEYSEERNAFHINHNFISNIDLNVVNFRKQFENAYTEVATCFLKKTAKDFPTENFDVYGDIGKKAIKTNDPKKMIDHIRNIDQNDSPDFFPTDILTDDDVNLFFDKFLIVCDTFSTDDLPSNIAQMWRESKMCKATDLVCSLETEKYIEGLHRTVSSWMRSSSILPSMLEAKDAEEIIKRVKLHLKYLLLKHASNKYTAEHHTQPLRAKPESLREKPLYKFLTPSDTETNMTKPGIFTFSTPYNSQFSSLFVFQTFQLLEGNLDQIVFIDVNTIEKEKQTILDMCESFDDYLVMVIDCEAYVPSELNQLIQTLSQSILNNRSFCIKIILLEKSQNKTFGEEFCFVLKDFEPNSIVTVIRANEWNTLFGTSVPNEVFMHENDDMSIILNLEQEQQKALQDPLKQCMVDDHYEHIRNSYVQRHFKSTTEQFDDTLTFRHSKELSDAAESTVVPWISFFEHRIDSYNQKDVIENMKFVVIGLENNVQHVPPGVENDWQVKVHILLGEAGCGKSSYLSWLGWHLQGKDRSSWVIRFNAIDYCTDFERLSTERTPLNRTKAMRFLYRMIHLALFVRKINQQTISTTDEVRKEAVQCADLLEFDAESKAIMLNEEKWKSSKMTSMQLIMVRLFQEKFNDKSLIVLFDGFDEIIPDYKDVVFNLLARIQEFQGIKGMYLTSRPYNLQQEFEKIFSDAEMHSLASFTNSDRLAALHMFMRRSFPKYTLHGLDQQIYLLGGLLQAINISLKDLCQIPIYQTMAMEVLTPLIIECVNFNETTIDTRIEKDMKKKFEKSQLVEQFVRKNLIMSNFEKHGIQSADSNPGIQSQMHKANKQTLRIHSILALYVIFDTNEREKLHVNDKEALEYMEEIKRGDVKTGIIEAVFDSKPLFIHRSFAEYFAAVWLFERRDRDEVKRFLKSYSYWAENRQELREYFDRKLIIESNCELPIHMAIVDNSLEQIKDKLKHNDAFVMEKDLGGRTVFHLMAITRYRKIDEIFTENLLCWPHLDEKDEILNWSALDYALMWENKATAINLIKFGAKIDLRIITDALFDCDGEELLKNLIYNESFMTGIANFIIVDIVETFKMEVVERVVDFILKEKSMYFSNPFFDDFLVNLDAAITLKTLCDQEPELFSICRMKKLLIEAFEIGALYIVEYLIIECQYDVPLEVKNYDSILEKCIAQGCNELFTTLFKSYCGRADFGNIHLQSVATRNQDNLRFSAQFNVWPIPPTFEAELFKTKFLSPLLRKALRYSNMFVIDYLLQIIPSDDCNDMLWCVMQQSEIYYDGILDVMSRIKYFISNSTGIKYTNGKRTTLLHHFIKNRFYELARMLIEEYGFEIGLTDTQTGWNAFHYCVESYPSVNDEMDIEEYNKLLNYMLAKNHAALYLSSKDNQGRNVLHLAVERFNISAVKIILQKTIEKSDKRNRPAALVADIFGTTTHQLNDDTKGMTLLHYVIGQKYYMLARFLIEVYGFDIGQTDTNNGWNAFHYCAIDQESWILFKHMITKDHVDLHLSAKDKQGRIVLHHAVINGNVQIARAIIQRKLDECSEISLGWLAVTDKIDTIVSTLQVDNGVDGMSLLHFAIASGQYNLANLLIQKFEFDIGETDTRNGWNAFHYCAHIRFSENTSIPKEYKDLLCLMMSKEHANHLSVKDKQDRNVLHVALINENICMIRAILQMKLEVCEQKYPLAVVIDEYIRESTDLLEGDGKDITLLHFAIESELYDLAGFLINECRFDVRKTNIRNGWNAFHYCANFRFFENRNAAIKNRYNELLIHMMMKENAALCLSAEDAKGRTVMDIALEIGNFLIVSYILLKKMESNELSGSAAIHANYIGETCDLLEANVDGTTLLHFSIASLQPILAIYLIEEHGFDIGKADTKNGWNAFHYCAIAEKRNISSLTEYYNLLNFMFANKHVDLYLSAKDKQGRNVLHIALINRSFVIASCILYRKMKERNEKNRSSAVLTDYIGEATHLLDGDGEGMPMLHYAILSKHYELAIFLIEEYGVNIGITNPKNGWNAFHCCTTIPFPENGVISIQYKKLLDCMMAQEHAEVHLSAENQQR